VLAKCGDEAGLAGVRALASSLARNSATLRVSIDVDPVSLM
jgi:hypothetical protein